MWSTQCPETVYCPKIVIRSQCYLIKRYMPGSLKKKMCSSRLDVDFSPKFLVPGKLFLMLKAHLPQSPACLPRPLPPDICTGTSQTAFGLQPQLPLEEASHATNIFISTGISRSRKGTRLDGEEWRSIELFFGWVTVSLSWGNRQSDVSVSWW